MFSENNWRRLATGDDFFPLSLTFISAAVLFLPLFVFLPKLIQQAMKADTDAAIEAFGKNEHTQLFFTWFFFVFRLNY
jgi:hypothetical protein